MLRAVVFRRPDFARGPLYTQCALPDLTTRAVPPFALIPSAAFLAAVFVLLHDTLVYRLPPRTFVLVAVVDDLLFLAAPVLVAIRMTFYV